MLCLICRSRDTHDDERDNPCVMSSERGKSTGHIDRGSNWLEELGLVAQPEEILRNLCFSISH
jgi:hypothetical protein